MSDTNQNPQVGFSTFAVSRLDLLASVLITKFNVSDHQHSLLITNFSLVLGLCCVVFQFVLLEKLILTDPTPNLNKCLRFYDIWLFTKIVMFTESMKKTKKFYFLTWF